jgi:heat shock protein HslJ
MNKTMYLVLCGVTVAAIAGISYYAFTVAKTPPSVVTTTPPVATSTEPAPKEYKTMTGKVISVLDTHPLGESLSTVTVTGKDFGTSSTFTFEKDRLEDVFTADLDKNGFDEIYLITRSQGSGSAAEITAFASNNDESLSQIAIPELTDADTSKGGLFEHYMGHDSFGIKNGLLTRSFPLYMASDTQNNPTGGTETLVYSLVSSTSGYSLQVSKLQPVATTTTATTTASSSATLVGTKWVWAGSKDAKGVSTTPKGALLAKFIMTLDTKKHMSSLTDCNTLGADYTLLKNALTFGPMLSTKMACTGSHEQSYSKLLAETALYSIKGTELTLTLQKGAGSMTFIKQ